MELSGWLYGSYGSVDVGLDLFGFGFGEYGLGFVEGLYGLVELLVSDHADTLGEVQVISHVFIQSVGLFVLLVVVDG